MNDRQAARSRKRTKQVIASMLKENTGSSMLDSGGHPTWKDGCYAGSTSGYGRAWERNQCREFEKEQHASLSFQWGYIEAYANLYHWLVERLEYDPDMDKLFHNLFVTAYDPVETKPKYALKSWFELRNAFLEWLPKPFDMGLNIKFVRRAKRYRLGEELGKPVTGLYGEGAPLTINTYNHSNLLSQDIEFTYFEWDGTAYVCLMIHNGADARGGYTAPRFFTESGYGEQAIFDFARGTIGCENGHRWDTDDDYHWIDQYGDGDLRDYRILTDEDAIAEAMAEETQRRELAGQVVAGQLVMRPELTPTLAIDRDFIRVDEDGNGECPKCGARLEFWA